MVDIKQTKQGAYPPKVFPAGAARSGCSFSHLVKQGTPAAHLHPVEKNLRRNHWHGQHVVSHHPQFSAFFVVRGSDTAAGV